MNPKTHHAKNGTTLADALAIARTNITPIFVLVPFDDDPALDRSVLIRADAIEVAADSKDGKTCEITLTSKRVIRAACCAGDLHAGIRCELEGWLDDVCITCREEEAV
jgi:hypothetical protein